MNAVQRAARRGFRELVLLGARGEPEPKVDPAAIRRIAVLRLDRRLGNQVILFPLLDALREWRPAAEIDVLAPGPYDAAYLGRRSVTRVVRVERSRPFSRDGWSRMARLRARRYDLVVEAGHHHTFSVSSALVTRLLGAPLRLGFRRGDSARVLNLPVDVPRGGEAGRARIFFELARRLDPGAAWRPARWETLPREREHAVSTRSRLGLEARTLGIHPGGRGGRRWDTERFVEVARRADLGGLQPVIFLGPAESGQRDRWREAAAPRWRLVEAPPLREFAALVETLTAWVSGDTGPLHLAVSLQVPAVGVLRHAEALESLEAGERYRPVYADGEGPAVDDVMGALGAWLPQGGRE